MGRNKKNSESVLGHRTELEQKKQQMVEDTMEELKGNKESILKPPAYLPADAKKEYRRIISLLSKLDLGELDLINICGYCVAQAQWLKITKELSKQPMLIEKVIKGEKQMVENPLLKIQKAQSDEIRKYGALCGITVQSRYQFATSKINMSQNEIEDEFDI